MTEIARGTIKIDLDDGAALAQLRAINNEFERTMSKIDREKATASIDVNTAVFDDKVKNAKRELKELQGEKARLNIGADDEEFNARIKAAQAKVKRLDGEKATVELRLKNSESVDKQYAKIADLAAKQADAEQKYLAKITRLEEGAEKRRLAGVRYQARVSSSLRAQQQRELDQAHSHALRLNKQLDDAVSKTAKARLDELKAQHTEAIALDRDRDKFHSDQMKAVEQESSIRRKLETMRNKELADLPKLQREYVELAQKIENLAVARRRSLGDPRTTQVIDFKVTETEAKMRALRETLERIGGPIDLDVNIHPGRRFGSELRSALQERSITGSAEKAGIVLASRLYTGFQNQVENKFSKRAMAAFGARTLGRVGDVFSSLSAATVRVGPFTATLRQLGLVMAVLGPTILDIVGALGSLISVTGAGLSGAATIGAGAITGLGLSFLGLKFSTRNVGDEIKQVRTSINALQTAQLKYGKSSDQAKAKQKELNNVLKQVSPLARETATGIEKFYADWDKRTGQTRDNLGKIARQGFQALDAIAPQWARRTNQLSGILEKGLGGAFKFLKSGTGKGLIDDILGDFNRSAPRFLKGLGGLGEAFLRFGREGAKYLPMVARGFDGIAQKVLGFTKSDKFGSTVARWVDSGRNLVRFFGAAGRLVTHFFGTGVDAGNRFVSTMTRALNRWDDFVQSPEGQKSFSQFFEQSVTGAQALFHALAPIASAFVTWASNLSPIVTGFLQGAGAVTAFVGQIVKLIGLQGPLGTLAATLGALWAVGKISAASRAIFGFSSALLGLKAAQTGIAATSALGARGVAPGGFTPAVVATATAAGPALTRAGKAATIGARGLTALGAAAGFANPYVGAAVLTAGAAYGAYRLLTRSTRDAKNALKEAGEAAKGARDSYVQNTDALADVNDSHKQAAINVRTARDALRGAKKGTDEYKQAQLDLRQAQRQLILSGEALNKNNDARQRAANANVASEQARLDALDKLQKGQRKQAEYEASSASDSPRKAAAIRMLADMDAERARKVDDVNRALNAQAAVSIQNQRAAQGMVPVYAQVEQKLGSLARLSRTTALKVALKFDAPKDVGKVAASAAATLKSGVPARIVTRIVADASSATAAIKALQGARITDKKFAIVAAGGIPALRTLEQIAGRKLTSKEQRIVLSGGDGALRVLAKILGIKLGPKNQRIQETGSSTVVGALAKILGIKLPEKRTKATVDASGAFGPIQSVIGQLSSIPNITRTVTIRTQRVGAVGKGADTTATGTAPGGRNGMSWVGEGSDWRGAKEMVVNQRTGSAAVVDKPTLMNLTPDDYVIPTEPAYRSKGRNLFREMAKDLGLPAYRGSKRPKLPKLISSKAADANNLKEVQAYDAKQQEEEDLNKKISIAERKVKEPSTFLKPNGKDGAGNPLFAIDQSAISTYDAQLAGVQTLQEQLIGSDPGGIGGLMAQLRDASTKAMSALGQYRKDRQANIKSLNSAKKRAAGPSKSKDKSTAAAAKKVISSANTEITRQKSMYDSSISVSKGITEDQVDANISRIPGYQLDLADTKETRSTLTTQAQAEAAAAAPVPETPDVVKPEPGVGEPGGPTAAEDRIGRLETEKALAGIGIGINGQPPRDLQAINNDLISAQTSRLAEGQALLNDTITSNDAEGYSIIQSAASAISSLRTEVGNVATAISAEQGTISSAMRDLYRSFGNNIQGTSASVSSAMQQPLMSGSMGNASLSNRPGAAAAPAGSNVQIVQNFQQQPDPMTWSQGIKYELEGLL